MGTSNWQNISWCVQAIMRIEPKRVLDVGVGFGRWGMVIREFAEVWFDRITPEQWLIDIEGIEAFPKNIAPYHEHFYSRIHVGDAKDLVYELQGGWDLVVLGDVLEHFYKSDGERLLQYLVDNAQYVLVNLPLGENWAQDDKYENPYEEHKAVWHLEDFDPALVRAQATFLDFSERPFASLLLSKHDPRGLRLGFFGSPRQGEASEGRAHPVDATLLAGLRERVAASDSIRSSRAWQMLNRARNNALLWRAASLLRRDRGDLISIRNAGPSDGSPGGEIVVERVESDASPVLWEFLNRRGAWELRGSERGALGQCLATTDPGAALRWFGYGAQIRVHLEGGPQAGACELRVGGQRHRYDLRRPTKQTLILDPARAELYDEGTFEATTASPIPDAATSVRASRLLPEHEALLERIRETAMTSVAVYVPDWLGIKNSTCTLFGTTVALPAKLDSRTRQSFIAMVEDAGFESLILSGGANDHLQLCRELHERAPKTRIKVLWHGSFLQVREDYAWHGLRMLFDLARIDAVQAIGFVKEGMAEFGQKIGLNAHFVMNYVPEIPTAASKPAEGGPHLGLWLSNEGWRKVPHAMAAAVRRIGGANLHYVGNHERLREFARAIGLKVQGHGSEHFDGAELRAWMRRMHLNLYVTLSECCPLLPLESLAVGTPCLLGPTSHLFRDDRYLFDRLVVPFPDSEAAIFEKAEQALAERAEIIQAYAAWAPGYNERARASVTRFVEA